MAKAASEGGGAALLHGGLPEEIIVWEILVRLPPKSLLRFRSVCRAWQRATSSRDFLLTHHDRQPSLPVVSGYEHRAGRYENIHALDHRAAGAGQLLQPVARLDGSCPEASCDGLLVLSKRAITGASFSVCNPATHQHAPLRQLSGFDLLAMYRHRPTGEYRLLLHWALPDPPPKHPIGCYILALGSDQPPRYIGGLDVAEHLYTPALLHDSLHWYPVHYQSDPLRRQTVAVFDTASESFRRKRAPAVPAMSYIFEMDATLGIYSHNDARSIVDIWVVQSYQGEVWDHEYRVELPVADMNGQFGRLAHSWDVSVVSVDP